MPEAPLKVGMKRLIFLVFFIVYLLSMCGCMSCIQQYTAPPEAPVSSCYPVGHDPYVPMDHAPSPLNIWDLWSSFVSPFVYGPPR